MFVLGYDDGLAGPGLTIHRTTAHTDRCFTDRDNQIWLVRRVGRNRVLDRLRTRNRRDGRIPDRFQGFFSVFARTDVRSVYSTPVENRRVYAGHYW